MLTKFSYYLPAVKSLPAADKTITLQFSSSFNSLKHFPISLKKRADVIHNNYKKEML